MQSMSSRMALLGDAVTPLCDLLSALDADKEAWRWIAILCLGFLMFEWWFYHRRTA